MKKVLTNIVAKNQKYTYDNVTCFEKPTSMLLDNIGEGYSNIFYLYFKLIECYQITMFNKEALENYFNTMKYIIEVKLNLKINAFEEKDNIHDVIKKQIDMGNPVLVGGNLKHLYYSKYYKEVDWLHLFIIKGYDEEKNIYYTIDDCHTPNQVYNDFFIEFDTLESMYQGYYDKEKCYVLYSLDIHNCEKKLNILPFLTECIDIILNTSDISAYKEIMSVKEIAMYLDESRYDECFKMCELLAYCVNYKELLYKELFNTCKEFISDTVLLDRLLSDMKELIKKWKAVVSLSAANCFRKKSGSLTERVDMAIEYEIEVRKTLSDIKVILEKSVLNKEC